MKKLTAIMLITLAGAFTTHSTALNGRGTTASDSMKNQDQFVEVKGPDLKSRLAEALKQARSRSPQTQFWVGYSFSVRPGAGIDVDLERGQYETPNAGIFLLYDTAGNAVLSAELYAVERRRTFDSPIYWLGQSTSVESLDALKSMIQTTRSGQVAAKLTDAISAHDDSRAESLLKYLALTAPVEEARITAIASLSSFPNQSGFLASLAHNDSEGSKIRQTAIATLGDSPDPAAVPALENLYSTLTDRTLKLAVVESVGDNTNHEAAVDFLIKVVQSEPDAEIKRTAVEALGDRTDSRSMKLLESVIDDSGADSELRQTALDALGSGHRDEAAPLLARIAKSHPNTDMRVQAVEQLAGASGKLSFLVSLASDERENLEVRRQAIDSISESPDNGALDALQKLHATTSNQSLKKDIVDAISQSKKGQGGAVNIISVGGLSGLSRSMNKDVVSHLGSLQDDHTVTVLSSVYNRGKDEDTKEGILESLSLTNTKQAVRKLIEVARHDSSSRLRKRAIFLLGQSNDPEAVEFLEEIAK